TDKIAASVSAAMGRALRFCMVTTFYPPYHFGGDALHVYRLSQALAERGHRVDVVHSVDAYRLQHPTEPETPFDHHPNVTVHSLRTSWGSASALTAHQLGRPAFYGRRLRAVLEGGPYDVIHFHNVSLMGGPGVLQMGRAVKLFTAHEYWLVCPTHLLFAFNREACTERHCLACTVIHYRRPPQLWRRTGALPRALGHVDCLLMTSRFALEKHREQGIDRPMVRLPAFVPAFESEGWPEGLDLPERPFFLYVGRLERYKGVHDLLRLFEGYRQADLVIVGAGSEEAALRQRACSLSHVRFVGRLHPAALGGLYRRAIALVVPSLSYETFGLTLAESLTCGTPVVARRIGALTENLEQSGGGLGFDSMDECGQAMERLRTEPELRATLARRGQEAAKRLWSQEAHLGQYLGLIDSLLAKKAGAVVATGGHDE
ncbi:MAG: hypothetical protein AUH81_03010, partial [Candidatus Rokubacteria bacterium 13_1_40CM_4_69_5]